MRADEWRSTKTETYARSNFPKGNDRKKDKGNNGGREATATAEEERQRQLRRKKGKYGDKSRRRSFALLRMTGEGERLRVIAG